MKRLLIAKNRDLKEGEVSKFQFVRDGKKLDGFVARFSGKVVAYQNLCQHIAMNLDFEGGRIFSRDGQHFICQTHGAIYEPLSGLCVRGPCEGERLQKLTIQIEDDEIWLVEK